MDVNVAFYLFIRNITSVCWQILWCIGYFERFFEDVIVRERKNV